MTVLDRDFLDRFEAYGAERAKVSRKLSALVRPAFVAAPGKTFVWSDFAQIEARMMPWLANSRSAEAKLDLFRNNDRDPKNYPDVYRASAGDLLDKDPFEIDDDERQSHGKVTELSLQFGGAVGALLNMAANYRVYIPIDTAKWMVPRWREKNQWAVNFWGKFNSSERYGLWGAACSAIENPGDIFTAGRVAYIFDKQYLRGTLICALPSGHKIFYPTCRWETVPVIDKFTKEVVGEKTTVTYRKGYGRAATWHGKLAENVTQAESATCLRTVLRWLAYETCDTPVGELMLADWMPAVGHTHDEAVLEVLEEDAPRAANYLHNLMVKGFDWSAGLPLAAEETINWYYTKAKVEHG